MSTANTISASAIASASACRRIAKRHARHRRAAEKARLGGPGLGDLIAETATDERGLAEAITWYRAAAEGGSPTAFLTLGRLQEAGRGMPADPEAALVFYRGPGGRHRSAAIAASRGWKRPLPQPSLPMLRSEGRRA